MSRTSTKALVDRLLGGRLHAQLAAWRDEDPPVSYEEMAGRLSLSLSHRVTGETVRRWWLQYQQGLESEEKAS